MIDRLLTSSKFKRKLRNREKKGGGGEKAFVDGEAIVRHLNILGP